MIVTLTFSPTIELSMSTGSIRPDDKLRCTSPRYEPGGGGINVARVARELGENALAVFPEGGATGASLLALLEEMQLPVASVHVGGWTRECFNVIERDTSHQYRFILPGVAIDGEEQDALLDLLGRHLSSGGVLIASGSLPPGTPNAIIGRLSDLAKRKGARFLLDTSGPALLAAHGAYLVKPNERELEEVTGQPLHEVEDIVHAARRLVAAGVAGHILVSRGRKGALLVGAAAAFSFDPVAVDVRNAVGAGDSMMAGVAVGIARGLLIQECVRRGIAAGTAAVMTDGSVLARAEDVERLYANVPAAVSLPHSRKMAEAPMSLRPVLPRRDAQ
ncbi:1-phosphofructokinase family hexose kinase [Pacificimonas sp. ICDLI1SI03]